MDLEIFLEPFRLEFVGGGGCGGRVWALIVPEFTAKLSRLSADKERVGGIRMASGGDGMSATAAACKNTDRLDRAVFLLTAD